MRFIGVFMNWLYILGRSEVSSCLALESLSWSERLSISIVRWSIDGAERDFIGILVREQICSVNLR